MLGRKLFDKKQYQLDFENGIVVNEKKEKSLRTEWEKAQDARETPAQRLERENKRLHTKVLRLDFESDLVNNFILHSS